MLQAYVAVKSLYEDSFKVWNGASGKDPEI